MAVKFMAVCSVNNLNRVLQRMKKVGGTFNGKKLVPCAPSVVIVGHRCCMEGHVADPGDVQRVKDWPPCRNVHEVRAFLGTCGVMQVFVKNFAHHSRPLVELTRKDTTFDFGPRQIGAMAALKQAITVSPAVQPIDYRCGRQVVLAVDSSHIAVDFILSQVGEDNKQFPARFGSIGWNEVESRYSQAKIKLYGLFRALRAFRVWLVGLPRFTVEVDAKYIKGMLNNPDVVPNAVLNRWIAAIMLFDFDLVHVPAERHGGPDGLSRRQVVLEDPVEDGDPEDWIDEACGFAMELVNWPRLSITKRTAAASPYLLTATKAGRDSPTRSVFALEDSVEIPQTQKAKEKDGRLLIIEKFLREPKRPVRLSDAEHARLLRQASVYFVLHDKLWRRSANGKHQVVVPEKKRFGILKQAHDDLGHKGPFVVRNRLLDRFWWPLLDQDVRWYSHSCHVCQTR
jgi:hypothetical protein